MQRAQPILESLVVPFAPIFAVIARRPSEPVRLVSERVQQVRVDKTLVRAAHQLHFAVGLFAPAAGNRVNFNANYYRRRLLIFAKIVRPYVAFEIELPSPAVRLSYDDVDRRRLKTLLIFRHW